MKRTRRTVALAGAIVLMNSVLAPALADEKPPPGPPDKSAAVAQADKPPVLPVTRLLVKYREGVSPVRANGAATGSSTLGFRLEPGRAVGKRGWRVTHLPEPMSIEQAREQARELASDPRVVAAEPSLRFTTATDVVPDDPYYATDQWDLQASYLPGDDQSLPGDVGVRMEQAWGVTKGQSAPVIAVLDTGKTTHPDLADRWVSGYDMVSADTVPFAGGTYTKYWTANDGDGRDNDPSDPGDWVTAEEDAGADPDSGTFFRYCGAYDSTWHGTHVAGTIGAIPNNGAGVAGMVWDARIQPVRVLGKCGGSTEDVADGIIWASGGDVAGVPKNETPAKVLNLSLGYGGVAECPVVLQDAIDGAVERGSVVVVAAGNSDMPADMPLANCDGTVSVAATSRFGDRSWYSNYGENVDLAAPGGDDWVDTGILSTWNSGATGPDLPTYGYMQGTSMAAPHVAAAVALYLSKSGNESKTPAEVQAALEASAHPFYFSGPSYYYSCYGAESCGAGILDVAALVGARDSGGRPSSVSVSSVEAKDGALSATWNPPSSDNATKYLVIAVDTDTLQTVSTAESTGTTAIVTGLTNGRPYYVMVRTGNAFGFGWYWGSELAVPLGTPAAPIGLSAFPADGMVTLSWSPPAKDPARAQVSGYEVSQSGKVIRTTDQRTVVVDGLTNGKSYTFSVRADSNSGKGGAVQVTVRPKAVEKVPVPIVKKAQTVTAPPGKVKVGKKVRMAKATSAGMSVQWTSTSKKICKVRNDRVLVAVKRGKCGLKAATPGSDYYNPLAATFTVKVKK